MSVPAEAAGAPAKLLHRSPIVLPDSSPLEQGVLGVLLIDNSLFDRVSDFLRADHFQVPVHGRLYRSISDLISAGKRCDAVLLKHQFADDDDLVQVGGVAYLADLMSAVVSRMSIVDYARQIVDISVRCRLIQACDATIDSARRFDEERAGMDVLSEHEHDLYAIAEDRSVSGGARPFSQTLTSVLQLAEAAYRREPGASGLSTGIIALDDILGGLRPTDLIILAGRPSMGKSSLATNIAFNIARRGGPTLLASLEMGDEQLGTRILAGQADISSSAVFRGDLTDVEFRRFVQRAQSLAAVPLYIDKTPAQTLGHLRKEARRLKRSGGLAAIVVDYIQLMRTGRRQDESRNYAIGEITGGLKAIAKEYDVPVLALSQLSRAVEQRDDKRPMLSDLRDSGSIEQDADVVAFVYRDEYYVERARPSLLADEDQAKYSLRFEAWQQRMWDCAGKAEVIIAKQRNGRVGTANLRFDPKTTTFSDEPSETGRYHP